MLEVGSIVVSQRGHDKNKTYAVLSICGDFAYLVNGKNKTLDLPKKKRIKHLKDTFKKIELIKDKTYDYEIATMLKKNDKMHKD